MNGHARGVPGPGPRAPTGAPRPSIATADGGIGRAGLHVAYPLTGHRSAVAAIEGPSRGSCGALLALRRPRATSGLLQLTGSIRVLWELSDEGRYLRLLESLLHR